MKKAFYVLFIVLVLVLSAVQIAIAAYNTVPDRTATRRISILNDPYYQARIIEPTPTSSRYAQKILSNELGNTGVRERTLSGALTVGSPTGDEVVLGNEPQTARMLKSDEKAIALSHKGIPRINPWIMSLHPAKRQQLKYHEQRTFQMVKTQPQIRERLHARRLLYKEWTGAGRLSSLQGRETAVRMLSKEYNTGMLDARRYLAKEAGISGAAQRMLAVEYEGDYNYGDLIEQRPVPPPTTAGPLYKKPTGGEMDAKDLRRLKFLGQNVDYLGGIVY